ncbi:MAG: 4Fe-4S ferredoxin [Bacteroidota bacterium]|nr:4Fe-4S ferredoxin [Bacteroidota bacterium]
MKRDIVKIDEELCNGCGDCIPNCHEGALQIIDEKARLVSDLMCDGLGACIGHCPLGAITIEQREAEAYNETKVMVDMIKKGKNTVIAHLVHLKEHQELELMKEGINYLKANEQNLDFDLSETITAIHTEKKSSCESGGCPGSAPVSINSDLKLDFSTGSLKSELKQWPVQFHLINPVAAYFKNTDLLLAADCVAFSIGNFHQDYLKGKQLIIACPKLDSEQDSYLQKLIHLIDNAKVNTITTMIMQVPCCGGLLQLVKTAIEKANRKVPVKLIVVGIEGNILQEDWI